MPNSELALTIERDRLRQAGFTHTADWIDMLLKTSQGCLPGAYDDLYAQHASTVAKIPDNLPEDITAQNMEDMFEAILPEMKRLYELGYYEPGADHSDPKFKINC